MVPDYHIHTLLCKHAELEPADYVRAAEDAGVSEICFTDHAPAEGEYDPAHRMSIDEFDTYRNMVESASSDTVNVLFGIEADYYPDCEAFLTQWLDKQDFDIVIGSIHFIRDWGFDNPDKIQVWGSVDVEESWREYFSSVSALAATGLYDVVGHLDLTKKFGYIPAPDVLKDIVAPALDDIATADMVIELNTSGLRKPVKEIYPSLSILKMAFERNISISFGSDAHTPGDVGYAFDEAVTLAKNAGYTTRTKFRKREKEQVSL